MGKQRSIFFKTLEKKKFIFPLGFCLLIWVALNTVGDDFVKNLRSKAIEQNFKIELFMQEFYAKLTTFKYFFFCDVNKSIMELHKENIKLKCEIENLKHIKFENDELYALLELKKNQEDSHASYEVIVAKIISVFSNDYVRSCVINVGSKDGVESDDIVRNADGFIGRVCEVHENWSCVLAITDNNSKIPVKIKAQVKEQKSDEKESAKESPKEISKGSIREPINAILSGDNSNFLRVSMKNEDSQIKEGDIAETAYLENPACNGIPVGKVMEEYGEFLIIPAVSFETIQNVCVIKNRDSSSEAKNSSSKSTSRNDKFA